MDDLLSNSEFEFVGINEVKCNSSVCEALLFDFSQKSFNNFFFSDGVALPYRKNFCDPISVGHSVCIEGSVLPNADYFTVNLCSGNDVTLHFNPRFLENYVVRNCRISDYWGTEECNLSRRMPFRRGCPFVLEILITSESYMIAVNGKYICSFSQKMDFCGINLLEILGDINVTKLKCQEKSVFPSPTCLPNEDELCYPSVFDTGIIQPGQQIVIQGCVKLLPHSFYINLQHGRYAWPHPIIPFHLSVRFTEDQRKIVFNSWTHNNGGWGHEKIVALQCLFPGRKFSLAIVLASDEFELYVNLQPLLRVKRDLPLSDIDTLIINGDVFTNNIQFPSYQVF